MDETKTKNAIIKRLTEHSLKRGDYLRDLINAVNKSSDDVLDGDFSLGEKPAVVKFIQAKGNAEVPIARRDVLVTLIATLSNQGVNTPPVKVTRGESSEPVSIAGEELTRQIVNAVDARVSAFTVTGKDLLDALRKKN